MKQSDFIIGRSSVESNESKTSSKFDRESSSSESAVCWHPLIIHYQPANLGPIVRHSPLERISQLRGASQFVMTTPSLEDRRAHRDSPVSFQSQTL